MFLRYKRPLSPVTDISAQLKSAIESFVSVPQDETQYLNTNTGVSIAFALGSPQESMFVMGGRTDFDEGGFVVPELTKNISQYLKEKTRKIVPYHRNYLSWWLMLVDRIGYVDHQAELMGEACFCKREHRK